jgi:GT2 family glycosyltransferase
VERDVLVGYVSDGSVRSGFCGCLCRLVASHPRVIGPMTFEGSWLPGNRNALGRYLVQQVPQDWLLTIDTDMEFRPEDVDALLAVADEKGPGLYSAPYATQTVDKPKGLVFGTMVRQGAAKEVPAEPTKFDWAGMGFMLIHRKVLAAFMKENPWLPTGGNGIARTEDIAFCKRVGEEGFDLWVVPDARPAHIKEVRIYAE